MEKVNLISKKNLKSLIFLDDLFYPQKNYFYGWVTLSSNIWLVIEIHQKFLEIINFIRIF